MIAATPPQAVREFARAKVNLTLRIPGRRPDGYHQIESLIAFASPAAEAGSGGDPCTPAGEASRPVADVVSLDPSAPVAISTVGDFATAIVGENIVAAALAQLQQVEPALALGHVSIEKNLPVGAGLGGGSANAAALLRAIRRINPDLAPGIDWPTVAAALGADVPVCLADRTSWVTGFGEIVAPVDKIAPLNAVLVNPCVPVPPDKTAQVFRALAAAPLLDGYAPPPPLARLNTQSEAIGVMEAIGNDLTPAATRVVPAIGTVLEALQSVPGCRYAALSGAGPTCFGIFDEPHAAAAALLKHHPNWWVRVVRLGGN